MPGADWKAQVDTRHPCWEGYVCLLEALDTSEFPNIEALNALLPRGLTNAQGQAIRFVPATRLPGVPYERHIFETGEVSTREGNWHDLFNALVWCRWPALKTAMNAMHQRHADSGGPGRRGRVRDALTLFDECGAIIFGSEAEVLAKVARRQWATVFRGGSEFGVCITGHALLEKFTAPYKSVTAHALLLELDQAAGVSAADDPIRFLDEALASRLLEGRLFMAPADLSPLPLMGLPGWWDGLQDDEFYSDQSVFRPPPHGVKHAPVFRF